MDGIVSGDITFMIIDSLSWWRSSVPI